MPILVCSQKNSSDFRTIRETKSARMFPPKTITGEIYVEFGAFSYQIKFVAVRKILLSALWKGSLGSSLCTLSLCVSQVRQLTMKARRNEDFRGCSRDDKPHKPVFIEETTSKAQVFKTVKFSIHFIQRS